MLLVFSQIENAKDYTSKAKEFHNCGLELSSLYNELRIFKTLNENQSIPNKKQFAQKISANYQRILEKHQNHEPIDNAFFKSTTSKYHDLKWLDVQIIKIEYYLKTSFLYHFLIVFPPLILFILIRD